MSLGIATSLENSLFASANTSSVGRTREREDLTALTADIEGKKFSSLGRLGTAYSQKRTDFRSLRALKDAMASLGASYNTQASSIGLKWLPSAYEETIFNLRNRLAGAATSLHDAKVGRGMLGEN